MLGWTNLESHFRKEVSKINNVFMGWRIKCKVSKVPSKVFRTFIGGIHGNATKLKQKLESHLSQYVHTVAGSNNVQPGGTKSVDLVLNLENSTFGKSNRTNGPTRMESEDIGHIPNGFRDDEY